MLKVRKIIFYKDYFIDFYNAQNERARDKIDEILYMITILERVPKKFFDHVTGTDGLFEIRIEVGGNIFRIFCCFDENKLIILLNGFQKKTQKTPEREIDKAGKLKTEYFKTKSEDEKEQQHYNIRGIT